jgi:hypothetical protein
MVTEVRSFLGLVSYYHRFIPDFSKIAKPMTRLLQKDEKFVWTLKCEEAFHTLRTLLTFCSCIGTTWYREAFWCLLWCIGHRFGMCSYARRPSHRLCLALASKAWSQLSYSWLRVSRSCSCPRWLLIDLRPFLDQCHRIALRSLCSNTLWAPSSAMSVG